MKKLSFFLIAIMALSISSCDMFNGKKNEELRNMTISDSLQHLLDLRDAEINDLLTTFNDVQQSFNEINEAEDRIALMKSGERNNSSQQIKENFRFIQDKMRQNREMINQLQQQLRESTFKGDELKRTLNGLIQQLETKDKELTKLAQQLQEKDLTIAAQDEHIMAQGEKITAQENTITEQNQNITKLSNQVDEQVAENNRKQDVITSQDQTINTAWYVFGTKSELKEQGVLAKGKVLQGNFNKNYFSKIDIRTTKEIKLYSKSAEILTSHPTASYSLQKDINNQYVLKIADPQKFWSTSKYLVIQVK
ncbi:MAG: hypothetical protein HUK06_05910 [Bacteroidaceae bacterium]|nr:hypothetical protein [Bacteroidaceae bacterium]